MPRKPKPKTPARASHAARAARGKVRTLLSLDEPTLARLDAHAAAWGLDRSATVRRIVDALPAPGEPGQWRCPCGVTVGMVADTEDWAQPRCLRCYVALGEPLHEPTARV